MSGNDTAIDKKYCHIANLSFFRLGNPAKVTEKIQKFTLDFMFCDDFKHYVGLGLFLNFRMNFSKGRKKER